ncbi:hypothetical protein B0J14DRAFT_321147 [Halenospora varia]|nr:hypothetical protein B0J14DRAFT_321147 [Halenospora varia]
MNRFRTKKKEKVADGASRPSIDSETASITPVKKTRTFGRGKKAPEPEPKLELDLINALPPSDDFRTSLLMNGLSARFSMLREQDDPKSKIGKASDDSVLFPKRQSRFNDFTFQNHGLTDIAEVSSINGSIRPPFAMDRKDSFNTLDGTDDDSVHSGSIMNRAKPGEGNNLFGGRQKIYKIPMNASSSTKSLTEGGGMGGRALYGDDVSQSAFQKLREREREQERQAREEKEDQSSRPPSPPLSGYNRNRETSSTTSSSEPVSATRTSTAATSFTSQRTPSLNGGNTPVSPAIPSSATGLERSTTKTRRLYENGLDQHLHQQQYSAMSRIDTLTRQRTMGTRTPPMNSPTNTFHSVDRWDRQPIAGKASLPNLRAASPPPNVTPLNTFDFAVKSADNPDSKPFGMASPPLSPPITEHDDPSVLPMQPNDRGKATALGAFTKPAHAYDENKYSQRQVQMQQGRETPPLRKHSPPRAFASRQQQQQQQQPGRMRGDSNATYASARSRSNSSAQRHFLPPDRIAENHTPMSHIQIPENREMAAGTFLSSPNDSAAPSPIDPPNRPRQHLPHNMSKMNFHDQNVNLQRPPESQHPAHRQRQFEEIPRPAVNEASAVQAPTMLSPETSKPSLAFPADSPTLGPTSTTTGLENLVRHLRSDSNSSSVYGSAPSAPLSSKFPLDPTEPMPTNEYSRKTNPWDGDEWDQGYYGNDQFSLEESKDSKLDAPVPAPLAVRTPEINNGEDRKPSWEKEMDSRHTRDGSTETQKEREDLKMDLAERRRRVKENLKSFVETESRSPSPLPQSDFSRDVHSIKNNALGLLKPKSSRGSLIVKTKEPAPSKAMKMLGIGNATMTSSPSPNRQNFDDEARTRDEENATRGGAQGTVVPPQMKAFRQARRDAQRDRERQLAMRHQQRLATDGGNSEWPSAPYSENSSPQREPNHDRIPPNIRTRQRTPSRERKPPPVTHSHRNNMQESKISLGSNRSASSPPSRIRDRSSSDEAGRSRSNSRVGPAGYFDPQKLQPLQTGSAIDLSHSPRPSPTAPFSINPTPVQPSPAGSSTNTPTSQSFQPQPRVPGSRKKSINKHDISEPTFVSSTSRIDTVNLPPEASLKNGMETSAPPIPPVNPMRRQTRGMFGALRGKRDEYDDVQPMPAATQSTEEMSTFSADEGDSKPRTRQKLRKSSSEGGNLNARARQAAFAKPSPAMPSGSFPTSRGGSPPRPGVEGGMF